MTEDIVQQTILKALVHADQFRLESSLKTWLASIAINEVHQVYRCRWRTRSVPLITENLDLNRHTVEFPKSSYEAKERELLVRQAISRLPHSYRSVVELCDLQRLPLKEAADRLRLTVSAVKSRRRRARQKLWPLVENLKPSS
jgi:RNA polymerase sigma-70 factor, ECF subfamily